MHLKIALKITKLKFNLKYEITIPKTSFILFFFFYSLRRNIQPASRKAGGPFQGEASYEVTMESHPAQARKREPLTG